MAKDVILLTTHWKDDYWHKPKEAKYTGNVRYTEIGNWDYLAQNCPLAALGIYYRKIETTPFVYLRIQGMRYDPVTQNPFFRFVAIRPSSTPSASLRAELPRHCQGLIGMIAGDQLVQILKAIGEEPPHEWLELVGSGGAGPSQPTWRSWVGEYFLSLEDPKLGDAEFEDRIAALLRAIGFRVEQKGHTLAGPYADGIAIHDDFGLVYDCKNRRNYAPLQEDIRALRQYLADEQVLKPKVKLYAAFIAVGFASSAPANIFHVNTSHLLRLLVARLKVGGDFNLRPLKLILERNLSLDDSVIGQYWRV